MEESTKIIEWKRKFQNSVAQKNISGREVWQPYSCATQSALQKSPLQEHSWLTAARAAPLTGCTFTSKPTVPPSCSQSMIKPSLVHPNGTPHMGKLWSKILDLRIAHGIIFIVPPFPFPFGYHHTVVYVKEFLFACVCIFDVYDYMWLYILTRIRVSISKFLQKVYFSCLRNFKV